MRCSPERLNITGLKGDRLQLQTIQDVDVHGKRVLVRVDFNVPMDGEHITDDTRLRATLPTIAYLREQEAKVVLCSHLGRPGGKVEEESRLGPIAQHLGQLLGSPVGYVRDCIGPEVELVVKALASGDVLLLENLRFHPGEEKNDPEFVRALASLAEVYINDAFGTAHRAHASTAGVAQYLPGAAGLLMEREVEMLGRILHEPQHPLAAVMGGAKISDKIPVLENLLGSVDRLFIGGGMAATFFRALGYSTGASLVEEERVGFTGQIMKEAQDRGIRLLLPEDLVVAQEFKADSPTRTVSPQGIPEAWRIMDIGPLTAKRFGEELQGCRTVLWNGPMGVFEFPAFAQGTRKLGEVIADLRDAVTVVGGGSTVEAATALGLADKMTHVSTGGGASLEFLEGRELPGLTALMSKASERLTR